MLTSSARDLLLPPTTTTTPKYRRKRPYENRSRPHWRRRGGGGGGADDDDDDDDDNDASSGDRTSTNKLPVAKSSEMETCASGGGRGDNQKSWLVVTIIVTCFGLMTVTIGTLVLMVSVRRASKFLLKHEFLMPLGVLALFVSTALLAAAAANQKTMEMCVVLRILPGLGYTMAFVGMLLQVLSDHDKNVYIVNPKSIKRSSSEAACCGGEKETGHFLIGLCLIAVQVIVLVAWFFVQPPNLIEVEGCQVCRSTRNLVTFSLFSFVYPLLIGIVVCFYSVLSSVKWKVNSGAAAAKCNVIVTLVCALCWSATAATAHQAGDFPIDPFLVSHLTTNMVILFLIFTQRVVARIRTLIIDNQEQNNRELQMTGNSLIHDYGGGGGGADSVISTSHGGASGGGQLTRGLQQRPSPLSQAVLDMASIDSREEDDDFLEEEAIVVKPTNGSLSMRAAAGHGAAAMAAAAASGGGGKFLHSHVNRSYTNTYSSCGSFKLPSVIAMPESSAWQQICRWQMMEAEKEEAAILEAEAMDFALQSNSPPRGRGDGGGGGGDDGGSRSSPASAMTVATGDGGGGAGPAGSNQEEEEEEEEEEAVYACVRPIRSESSPSSAATASAAGHSDNLSYTLSATTSTVASNHLGQTDRDTKVITLRSLTRTENGTSSQI